MTTYYTSEDVRVYIQDIWIDDAFAVVYDYSHNKYPVYGYNDIYARTYANGRAIVSGQLIMNSKIKNVLTRAILGNGSSNLDLNSEKNEILAAIEGIKLQEESTLTRGQMRILQQVWKEDLEKNESYKGINPISSLTECPPFRLSIRCSHLGDLWSSETGKVIREGQEILLVNTVFTSEGRGWSMDSNDYDKTAYSFISQKVL